MISIYLINNIPWALLFYIFLEILYIIIIIIIIIKRTYFVIVPLRIELVIS
jgi:hypothetical protein